MIALCKTNEAFEDILTSGKGYRVIELRNGSVLLADDQGNQRWFGLSRFALQRAETAVTC